MNFNLNISPGDIIKFSVVTITTTYPSYQTELLVTSTQLVTTGNMKFLAIHGKVNDLEGELIIDANYYYDITLSLNNFNYCIDSNSIYINNEYVSRDILHEYLIGLK